MKFILNQTCCVTLSLVGCCEIGFRALITLQGFNALMLANYIIPSFNIIFHSKPHSTYMYSDVFRISVET